MTKRDKAFDLSYAKTINSFTGADIVASIEIPGICNEVIGNLQTLSYSTHRDINPVRTLSRINPSGFVRGPRTTAGTLIFSIFDQAFVKTIQDKLAIAYTNAKIQIPTNNRGKRINKNLLVNINKRRLITDEMPPFNITASFCNEDGNRAKLSLFNVIIMNEGQVMSVEDIFTESTMQYVAMDIDLIHSV